MVGRPKAPEHGVPVSIRPVAIAKFENADARHPARFAGFARLPSVAQRLIRRRHAAQSAHQSGCQASGSTGRQGRHRHHPMDEAVRRKTGTAARPLIEHQPLNLAAMPRSVARRATAASSAAASTKAFCLKLVAHQLRELARIGLIAGRPWRRHAPQPACAGRRRAQSPVSMTTSAAFVGAAR